MTRAERRRLQRAGTPPAPAAEITEHADGTAEFRFRGGVFRDASGRWGSVVEVAGRRYESEQRFVLEESAIAEYEKIRARILGEVERHGLTQGPNLGGYVEIDP